VVPALAVAGALRAEGAQVAFIGAGRAEAELVPRAGYELHAISVEGLSRTNPLRALRALARAAAAVPRARRLLRALKPDAVLGGGGYVAAPVVIAARTLGIPAVLTEADSRIGLSNRLLAPLARRVCLSFGPAPSPDGRYRVTGRPIFPFTGDRETARAAFGVAAGEILVLVFGGSLGARSINLAAVEAFAQAPFRVLHVCGRRDHAELAGRTLAPTYELREQLEPGEFSQALAAADLAVARAGGSVFELAAHGLPAILVPYPHATGDHQRTNAAWMARADAAVVIDDCELTPARLADEVQALLFDRARLQAMARAAAGLARPDAAADVAAELLAAAEG
jgi:UDP-N-acetylglucosamine--N-acetylmuramyl-(pentapeptide) pyrophosphoryl-undecaprenol N-acetylglucosamine transferase